MTDISQTSESVTPMKVEGPDKTSLNVDTNNTQSFQFEAEISQLMNLIINTFYSNKDIFLRELVSNASDAIDKVRYTILKDGKTVNDNDLKIKITPDKENKVIIIEDTGIGMSKEELTQNLGTIANSGTKNFMENLRNSSETKDVDLIGQFGVGFYSAYLVANKVDVVTSRYGESETWLWESDAGGSYKISQVNGEVIDHGTRIILHMKEEQMDYVDEFKIRDIIKKHSQFVNYQVELYVTKTEEYEVEDEIESLEEVEKEDEPKTEELDGQVEDADDDDDEKKKPKKEKKMEKKEVRSWELLNKDKPLWCRSESEITKEEYESLYKNLSSDWGGPLAYTHFSTEGSLEFKGIIFIPERAPFDMFSPNKDKRNFKLYVKRVFIMDDCKDLIPEWLGFIRGVIDSNDLPLNVSREMLQQNKIMKVMKKKIISKTVELLTEIYEDSDKCKKFYENFSRNIKLAIYEEEAHRDKLSKFLKYYTNRSGEEMVTLDTYVSRMKEGQKKIYYIAGESKEFVQDSVFLEQLNNKGYEVIFMVETIDEYMIQQLKKYGDYEFVSITQEGLDLKDEKKEEDKSEEEKAADEATKKTNVELCQLFKETLGSKVEKVVIGSRIVDSPTCIVTANFGWSANMERIMKAQALGDSMQNSFMAPKKTMEINPDHRIIKSLKEKYEAEKTDPSIRNLINMLYDVSCISSGFQIDDVSDFARKFHNIMEIGLGIDDDDEEVPELEEEKKDELNEMIGGVEQPSSVEQTEETPMEEVD